MYKIAEDTKPCLWLPCLGHERWRLEAAALAGAKSLVASGGEPEREYTDGEVILLIAPLLKPKATSLNLAPFLQEWCVPRAEFMELWASIRCVFFLLPGHALNYHMRADKMEQSLLFVPSLVTVQVWGKLVCTLRTLAYHFSLPLSHSLYLIIMNFMISKSV